ncbi:MAG: hypothetical protein J7L14_03710 [Candidatus Diapherotrites archaeon]|nr:hypothetical protein [Candidatus Diapherotrites archaeon]
MAKVKILNLTQHEATKEQLEAGVTEPVLKEMVKRALTFEQIPTRALLKQRARMLALYAKEEQADYALIGGAPFFMSTLERALKEEGITPIYAFSKRECIEEKMPDGSVEKVQVFRHIGFVEV